MKYLNEAGIAGRRALIRVDFNVPLDDEFRVTEDNRIREAIPSIQYILEQGGSCVLMSHLGRPKKGPEHAFSLRHTLDTIRQYVPQATVSFADDCIGAEAFAMSAALKPGEILVLENLRFYKEEEAGDEGFAEKLSRHGDFYVNDAFGTAHRAHASTTIVARFFAEKYCGFLLQREIENANKVLTHAERPVVAIMGGAKVSDKILLIENLLSRIDYLLIGGGMAYTFLRARGFQTGKSLVEEDKIALAAELFEKATQHNVRILIPTDSVISDKFGEDGNTAIIRHENFPADMMGLDIGPATFETYYDEILKAKTILWNGPMGVFEMEKFSKGTFAVASAVVEATKKGAFSLIGGGDSAAAISKAGLEDQVSYVSTGGGALLEYLEGKTLPGIAALS